MHKLRQLQAGRWYGNVSGRAIAIAEVAGIWLVYVDYVLLGNPRFRTAEAAYEWVSDALPAVGKR